VSDGDGGEDRNPDRVRYLIALAQAPVAAADRERDDHTDQRSEQGPETSEKDHAAG